MDRAIKIALGLALATTLTACGTDPTKPDAGQRVDGVKLSSGVIDIAKKEGQVDLADDDRVVCKQNSEIGSHMIKRRCVTRAEKRKREEEDQAAMRQIVTPPPSAGSNGIGR